MSARSRAARLQTLIPEYARCEIDVRFTSMSEAERIENEIRNLKSFDERVKIEIAGAINRPPLERTENVVKLYEKARQLPKVSIMNSAKRKSAAHRTEILSAR